MNLNYKNDLYFKYKFGRDPKEWSIEKLHQLFLESYSRHISKREKVIDVISRIEKELPDAGVYSNRKTRVLYKDINDKIYKRVLSFQDEFNSWGVGSWEEIQFKGKTLEIREEKLNLLLSCKKQFELGTLYDKFSGDDKYLYRIPWEALCEKVNNRLRERFKNMTAPEYFTIKIGDKSYVVHCDDQYRYSKFYKSFSLKNEVKVVDL